jgi:hypothetical protein
MSRRNQNDADRRRENLRINLWPGSEGWIWTINDEAVVGFATMSRLMPWICTLIRDLSGGRAGDPSSVYLELWCKDWGQGIVSIQDEQECAFAAGYSGNRAVRTWRERMFKLVELGFIKSQQEGNREFGQVLLLNPITVCAKLRADGKVPDEWWTSFVRRAGEIKAAIPKPPFFQAAPTASEE